MMQEKFSFFTLKKQKGHFKNALFSLCQKGVSL